MSELNLDSVNHVVWEDENGIKYKRTIEDGEVVDKLVA